MDIPDKTIETRYSINEAIDKGDSYEALTTLDAITSGEIRIEPEYFKIQLVGAYIQIAESFSFQIETVQSARRTILKAIGLLRGYRDLLNEEKSLNLLYDSLKARAFQINYQINHQIKAINRGETKFDFTKVENIYDIKDTIQESIKLYRQCLIQSEDKEEIYANRNNFAVSLSRVGRFVECMQHYEDNINFLKERPQSNLSWADNLYNMKKMYDLRNCASIWLKIGERYFAGSHYTAPENIKNHIYYCLDEADFELRKIGFELTQHKIETNREEECNDINEHPEIRKYSLNENITLCEHALYCSCRDSRSDDLNIGDNIPKQDQHLETIKSEFAFARYNFFKYANDFIDYPDDYTELEINQARVGYSIEHLKQSFKLSYSILDKIGNGIIDVLDLDRRENHSYFEDVFYHYREPIEEVRNINLCALYSLSLELNQSNGDLRYFKKLRNTMEHETNYKILTEDGVEFTEENKHISELELKAMTLELMKITRSAIFSFVFLTREINKDNTG